ncbi:MAG: TonB-dependent receptor [Methylococcaceae bacterium]|nr:TonB-dependent receptor [Methylococcaceae bacterium]
MKNKSVLFLTGIAVFSFLSITHAEEKVEDSSTKDDSVIYLNDLTITQSADDASISPQQTLKQDDILKKQSQISDTAKLLDDTAGVSFQSGGGVSSIPIIHGLNDTRVKIEVNGMTVNSSCPNHMNPALASIDRSSVGKITILQGITPVSMGGDSIAGTISVESAEPVFAEPEADYLVNGTASSFYRSNGNAFGGNIGAGLATEHARIDYSFADTQSSNYKDGNGTIIKSTRYQSQNHAASLAFKWDSHLLELKGGLQQIPYQGFPTARMDLTNNESAFGNLHYTGDFDWGSLDGTVFLEDTSHTMDYERDRVDLMPVPIFMPMETRSSNVGYKLQAELPFNDDDLVRVGSEFHSSKINDYWPATSTLPSMMGPDTFLNLNNATRDRFGLFAEWERIWSDEWQTMLGLRYDRTMADTGDVQGYNTSYDKQALEFNALDHERNFDTIDIAASVKYMPNDWANYNLGYARKNRAPSLHELYPWSTNMMVMTMIGWFGDGNAYVGNIDLKTETAHNITFTSEFFDPTGEDKWSVKLTPYFSYVENFIDVDLCQTCRQPNNGFSYLRMANHDALLWGVDVSGRVNLYESKKVGQFSSKSIMSYVMGRRMDGDNLYHMMPFNLKWSIDHQLNGWQNSIEMQFVDTKDDVQGIRNELETASYILLNMKTSYAWQYVSVDLGVDNILDKQYYAPLSGVYIGDQYPMTLIGSRPNTQNLAGQGRSVYVGLTLKF